MTTMTKVQNTSPSTTETMHKECFLKHVHCSNNIEKERKTIEAYIYQISVALSSKYTLVFPD